MGHALRLLVVLGLELVSFLQTLSHASLVATVLEWRQEGGGTHNQSFNSLLSIEHHALLVVAVGSRGH